jgi:hypothetical protein
MRDYLHALTRTGQIMALLEPRPYQTHSLRNFWTMIIPWPTVAFMLYLASAVVVLVLLVQCWKNKSGLEIQFAALLIATVLVSPHLTVYDLVILTPAFLLLGDWTLAHRGESQSLPILIYSCFVLFLLGPIVRLIHVQFSVIAMTAIVVILYRISRQSVETANNQLNPA